jgi:hypothetical protein
MQVLNWHLPTASEDDDGHDAYEPKSPEELVDRFGVGLALLILCVGAFLAGMWLFAGQSFTSCSALKNITERSACYEDLRQGLLKSPAKGADLRY